MSRIPASLRQTVIAASQGRCAYCHSPEKLMGVAFEIDHITPRSTGGRTTISNLCLSCPTCNRHKTNRTKARDPVTRRTVRLFRPNYDRWPDHFTWSDGGFELIGLTPTGRATIETLQINRPMMMLLRQYWKATGLWASD